VIETLRRLERLSRRRSARRPLSSAHGYCLFTPAGLVCDGDTHFLEQQPVRFENGEGNMKTQWQVTLQEDGSLERYAIGWRPGKLAVIPFSNVGIVVTSSRLIKEQD
jgi:hypothetical protein